MRLKAAAKLLYRRLDLTAPSLSLVARDKLVLLTEQLILSAHKFVRKALVMLRDLCAKVAAPCVDNQILVTLVVAVYLNEMIASAEGSDAALQPLCVLEFPVAFQLHKLWESHDPSLVYFHSRGYVFPYRFVQLFKVDPDFSKLNRIHSAADVNAYDVWYHHIAEISGKAYYTALPCVDVRHYANTAALYKRLVAEQLYLLLCCFLDNVGVYYRR